MRRATAVFVLISFAATASGLMRYVHLQQHVGGRPACHDGRVSLTTPGDKPHDETTCAVCVTLSLPMSAAGYTPLLAFLGLFVAFLTLVAQRLAPQREMVTSNCRGPPAF